ncbi:hypothetical protein OPV22_028934 [Ensete ventricosum]|uniref:Uncharacterized protein n=1 Tax=Ensete ventricosum TaxID=4639 RepID=A0AAV8P4J7_ENSVE|nr:hypothetical protein OPV22_028934 [Ensete ventricosum]
MYVHMISSHDWKVKDASCLLCLVDWKNWNRAFASSIYADMVKLKILKGMLCVPIGRPASSPVREAPDGVTKKHPAEGEVTHPNKRTKLGTRKWLQSVAAYEVAWEAVLEEGNVQAHNPEGRSRSGWPGAKP